MINCTASNGSYVCTRPARHEGLHHSRTWDYFRAEWGTVTFKDNYSAVQILRPGK